MHFESSMFFSCLLNTRVVHILANCGAKVDTASLKLEFCQVMVSLLEFDTIEEFTSFVKFYIASDEGCMK